MPEINYREALPEDNFPMYRVFRRSINVLIAQRGLEAVPDLDVPSVIEGMWAENRAVHEHIAATVDRCFVAEEDGEIVGFARAIRRGDVRQLTEFFVAPDAQSSGIGRELLTRTFPKEAGLNRVILATSDSRALARYMKAQVYPQNPVAYFAQAIPQALSVDTDLNFRQLDNTAQTFAELNRVDQHVIGYEREVDHRWFAGDDDRTGYGLWRDDALVGYAYFGAKDGPVALLDPDDFPAALAFGERLAAESEQEFNLWIPMNNRGAIQYMLSRHAKLMGEFIVYFLSERSLGHYEQYIYTNPILFS